MKLRKYLRHDFEDNIRNKLIKEKCDYCGEMNNLHLHHVDMFSELLNETLLELELEELDTHDYTKKELNLIRNVMLGKQIKIQYVTLCEDCHRKVHDDITKNNYYNPYGSYIQLDMQKINKLNLDYKLLSKFIKLACHMDYDNQIIFSYSGKQKRYSNDFNDIRELLKISDSHYYEIKQQLIDNNLIYLENDKLIINKKYIIKGRNNKDNIVKVFCDSFIKLYENTSLQELKLLGKVISSLESMKHNKLNYKSSYYVKNILNMTLTTRTMNAINNNDFLLIENGKIIYVNPKYFYDGILDTSLQLTDIDFNKILQEAKID
jgi:hypothetical protein